VGPWRGGATRLHNGRLAAVERTRVWCWPCWHGTAEPWQSIAHATAEGEGRVRCERPRSAERPRKRCRGRFMGSKNSRRITCRAIAAGVRGRYSRLRATARGRGAARRNNGSAQHACIYPSSRTDDDGSGLSHTQTSASGVDADGCGRGVCARPNAHTDRRVSFLRRPRPPHRRVLHALPTPPGCSNAHVSRPAAHEHSPLRASLASTASPTAHCTGDSRALHRQACPPSFRRRSLIPGALASSDGAQNSTLTGRAGRWLASGGVSCLTFISRPSPPRRTHRPCCDGCPARPQSARLVSLRASLSPSRLACDVCA
jgi:hypothetical protein